MKTFWKHLLLCILIILVSGNAAEKFFSYEGNSICIVYSIDIFYINSCLIAYIYKKVALKNTASKKIYRII